MFDVSFGEVVLVAAAAVIFLRPEDVPVALRAVGRAVRAVRVMTQQLKRAMDSVTAEIGADGIAVPPLPTPRMIQGDDGRFYEAYDVPDALSSSSTVAKEAHGDGR